jgi:hypothetical protein
MISLLFDSAPVQSTCSTSQPKQQKSVLWRLLRRRPNPVAERSVPQAHTSHYGTKYASSEHADRPYLRHPAEASKKHAPSSSNSPDHPFDSGNTFSGDRLCLVCGVHCSASCGVCDQDFCSTHLYACIECNDQYCSRCLDDHQADGHWTDSDTAAELNHAWRDKSSSGGFRVGSMHLSPPLARDVFPVTKPHLSLTPAPPQVLDRTQRSGTTKRDTLNAVTSVVGHTQRSSTSQRDSLNALTSPVAFLLHAIRQGLSLAAECITLKLLSQSEIPLEVSL